VIRYRLQVFAETTSPLIAYYRDRGILLAVDADQPPESVTTEIRPGCLASRWSGTAHDARIPPAHAAAACLTNKSKR
jgi:hypothetical protein